MTMAPLLPLALLLCLLASTASPAPAASSQSASSISYNADSKTGISKASGYSGEGSPAMDPAVAGRSGDGEDLEEATSVGEHKIRVRDAGPVRFWSGSRYGRSGRSSGPSGNSETQSHGSSVGMAMSLRSSDPVIRPRHDRFFLGSRYGKRAPGPRGAAVLAEWRQRGSEEEEEDGAAGEAGDAEEGGEGERQEGGEQEVRGQEEVARALKEALRLRALPKDSEEVFGVASQRLSSAIQPAACIYMGIGNLYRCYEGRREGDMH